MGLLLQVGSSSSRTSVFREKTHPNVIFDVGLSNRLVSGERFGVVVVMENEVLLDHLAIQEVNDDHMLASIRYIALEADVGPSKSVVPCNHHTIDLSRFELFNSCSSLLLEGVLEHFESVENKVFLDLFPSPFLHILLGDRFIRNRQHSKAVRSIFSQHLVVIFGN